MWRAALKPTDQGESRTFIRTPSYRRDRRKGSLFAPFVDRTSGLFDVTVIIAGAPGAASTHAEGRETAADTVIWSREEAGDGDSIAELADALVRFEADAAGQQVDRIVLADDSDTALAAALVGAKLPVEVLAVPAARDGSSPNARVIAQLAGAYTDRA
jgi:hypothetical protein